MTEPRRFRAVPPQVDLPAMERDVLALWAEHDTFARSLEQTADGEPWTFYEGPPTANGMPGTHHVEARVFKDVFPRFKTMQGYHVARKAGWDCHGLPVEIAVEKELGFTGKGDIEAYGVAEFNARCRESVLRHVGEFEAMTERMGYWVDMSDAYRTMDPEYVAERVVVAQADLRQGPAGAGPPGRALLPALRHRPVRPRAGPGLRDGRRPVGLRPLPADQRAATPAARPCWSGPRRPGPWCPTPPSPCSPDVTYVVATDGDRVAGRWPSRCWPRSSATAGR